MLFEKAKFWIRFRETTVVIAQVGVAEETNKRETRLSDKVQIGRNFRDKEFQLLLIAP